MHPPIPAETVTLLSLNRAKKKTCPLGGKGKENYFVRTASLQVRVSNGSPGRTRTSGGVVNSHLLYQLSYRGTQYEVWIIQTLPGSVNSISCADYAPLSNLPAGRRRSIAGNPGRRQPRGHSLLFSPGAWCYIGTMEKKKIGLIFGGVSAEHEISIITFDQVHKNIDKDKYEAIPIYITLEGDWICDDKLKDVTRYKEIFTGNKGDLNKFNRRFIPPYPARHESGGFLKKLSDTKLEIDIAFPLVHGTGGEDGSLQGLLELADIPYVGSNITASAVGMDKVLQKHILKSAGLPVVKFTGFLKAEIETRHDAVKKEILDTFRFPIFIKPASCGSSVGVSKVDSAEFLAVALDEACRYDRKVIVEEGVAEPREINCAVMGDDDDIHASVCEEVFSKGFLDYKQKYLAGGKKGRGGMANVARTIPADIPPHTAAKIQDLAKKVFRTLDCAGAARVDFLLAKDGNVYITELNSIPGSLSFYLWEKSGFTFPQMLDKVIDYAQTTHRRKKMLRRASGFNAVQGYLAGKKDE